MSRQMLSLLQTKRFWPLFSTQFLGAFNDNLFKNALVILITYRLSESISTAPALLITAAAGLFILPFFLFSATAGQLADKYDKARLIQMTKALEIAIMGTAAYGFYTGDAYFLLGVLFLMGSQSTFFGPMKYAILPQHLDDHELLGGNALVEAATFLAILLGTIAGGLLVLSDQGVDFVTYGVIGVAILGFLTSLKIPAAPSGAPNLKINWNFLAETGRVIKLAKQQRSVYLAILGISWFWLLGALFLSQFPTFAKEVLSGNEEVVTLFLGTFSLGIGVGSLLCNRLLKGTISALYVPLAAVLMTVFMVDLYFAASLAQDLAPAGALLSAADFLQHGDNWRVLLDLVAVAIFGGLYIVPLYAILQHDATVETRARMVAANNILNALFMVAVSLIVMALLALDMTIPEIFLTFAILNAGAAFYICRLLPDALVKSIVRLLMRRLYKVEVRGLEHLPPEGTRMVIVANHTSFLDGLLLGCFLPMRPIFAINDEIAKRWWVKAVTLFADVLPMDPTKPMSLRDLIHQVEAGRPCVIFPEGRITVTGALMKIYEGPGMVANKADALLVPIRIDGAEHTLFSRLKGIVRRRWFPKITLTIQPPRNFREELGGQKCHEARGIMGDKLYDIMSDMTYHATETRMSLFEALLATRERHGGSTKVAEDIQRQPLTLNRLVVGSYVLGVKLSPLAGEGETIGVLLPNTNAAVVTFFALQAFKRVPAMLNFTAGAATMIAACKAAQVKTVVTARQFIEKGGYEKDIQALSEHVEILYLEDLRKKIYLPLKLMGLVAAKLPKLFFELPKPDEDMSDKPAAILFTSGSEGKPKGVVISHSNILSNIRQLGARVDFNQADTVFNALPMFHCFGLTAGTLLPVLSGIKTFLYPSPLHYRIVPEMVYDSNATIMFGTDTFLRGYAKVAHPYDFYTTRYIFAGAEKVKAETRQIWMEKFGVRIFEGYGVTETTPVVAVNTAMHYKAGTVGRLLPAMEYKLEPVPGVTEGGRLLLKGPNVMLGYMLEDQPGVIQPPKDGWHDTGDICTVDEQNYITIKGRAKRFAKIAGEMVSLTAVEELASQAFPACLMAVVAVHDDRKGEKLILLCEDKEVNRDALLKTAKEKGLPELWVPREIRLLDKVPVLGTGKVDYVGCNALVKNEVEA